MIEKKGFYDDDQTAFFTQEIWDMSFVGAWIRITQPKYSRNLENDTWDLWLDPELARKVAAELIEFADSVEKQEAEFERNKRQ